MARLAVVLPLLFLVGCGQPKAKTAKEFVELYAKQWEKRNVDGILAMRIHVADQLSRQGITQPLPPEARAALVEADRQQVKAMIDAKDMWFDAWRKTRYENEKDHGDHVHVEVRVGAHGPRSDIVLVREPDGYLKVHPRPSVFMDCGKP